MFRFVLAPLTALFVILVLVHPMNPVSPYGVSIATGDSMQPTIQDGSLVLLDTNVQVENLDTGLNRGDIVAVEDSCGKIVVHRLVSHYDKKDILFTQGDARGQLVDSSVCDKDPTRSADVIGKVVYYRNLPIAS